MSLRKTLVIIVTLIVAVAITTFLIDREDGAVQVPTNQSSAFSQQAIKTDYYTALRKAKHCNWQAARKLLELHHSDVDRLRMNPKPADGVPRWAYLHLLALATFLDGGRQEAAALMARSEVFFRQIMESQTIEEAHYPQGVYLEPLLEEMEAVQHGRRPVTPLGSCS